jgi:transcriptional regulator with XRE-family HTH domain
MSNEQSQSWIDQIDAERERQGISKNALASACGLSQGKVTNILNGNVPGVTSISLQKMADALGMKLKPDMRRGAKSSA